MIGTLTEYNRMNFGNISMQDFRKPQQISMHLCAHRQPIHTVLRLCHLSVRFVMAFHLTLSWRAVSLI